jgi:hypothetical protein
MAAAAFIEGVDNLFDSFNGGMRVDPGIILRCPLNEKRPHVDLNNCEYGDK